jgi:hypothetical protein
MRKYPYKEFLLVSKKIQYTSLGKPRRKIKLYFRVTRYTYASPCFYLKDLFLTIHLNDLFF